MKAKIYDLLKSINENVYLQGTAPDKLPDSFITYTTASISENKHYDNVLRADEWMFYVYIYSTSALYIEETRKRLYNLLKAEGFKCINKGQDVPSGTTTHTGWAMTFMALDYQ